ncbi:MAG: peptidase domain-containing ABC transporter [Firmicutes bacterium]|nr:peptidase domain-containing ABC transporter [Bacillota bacterium]
MKKYPIVLQDEIKDCGVSCIQMIIKYYGGYVKKSNLLEMTKTSKKGTTAFNIKDTLINLGFDAKGIKCELKDINKDNIVLPCIASVTIDNSYKHFIVIYEINFKKKYLVIGDPADKVRKITYKDFIKIFNNVLIVFFPIKTLPIEEDSSQIKFILNLLKPHKKTLINIFILSIFITSFSIITSFYTEYMINSLSFYSKKYLILLFCIFFSIYILKILSDYFRNKLLLFINQKLDLVLTLDVFEKIIKLPYSYYQNRTTGDVISRINDLESVRDMISKVALSIFVDLPLTIVSLTVLYFINKTLFIIGLIILVLYFIIIVVFRSIFNDYIKKIQTKKGEATSLMVESISGFETVKGMHIESNIKDKFEKRYVKFLKDIFNYQNLFFIQNLFKEIIDSIGFIVIILVGCILVISGEMSVGRLLTFTSLLVYFLEPIKSIINLDNMIKEAKNALKRVLDIVSYEQTKDGLVRDFKNGEIEFKNLDFSFNDRDYILKNINLKIKEGSKVMVIGKSGSGKSTLFKILMRFYKLKNNKVFINNIDLNSYYLNTLNNNILYLGQNEILFNDTLYNNLVFDNSNSSNFFDVCRMCYVDKIMDSNLGYNMMIEENGFNLSGGEKQRIMLARTLLKNFNILIIDEGLSQVDVNMERKILKNIFEYYKDKTIIVISHRLDNLDLFDSLVKIEKGVVCNVCKNG